MDAFSLDEKPAMTLSEKLLYGWMATTSIVHIYFNTLGTVSELWVAAIHFGCFGLLCAFRVDKGRSTSLSLQHCFDALLAILAISSAAYLILFENALYDRGVKFTVFDWFFSLSAVLVVIELARRVTGWFIPCLILLSLSYVVWWGRYMPGVFQFSGLSVETLLFRSYFSPEGMFGQIAQISWSFVFMFILFGAFLLKSGAGDFIINLARSAAGRFVGGPGLVAVLGSGLMGSVSGSSVANTASTGVITIPLMKKAGFPARFAAGVEAAASTGGQLMPPVMGAGAFIMVAYTGISYSEIMAAALFPAILYFLSVAFFVRIEARKHNVLPVATGSPDLKTVIKSGWHCMLPLAVLVTLLIQGFTATYAAGFSILTIIVLSRFTPKPMGLKAVLDTLVLGAKNMISTAILLIAVGLVVNVVSTTGLGNTFSLMITDWAGGSLILMLLLIAVASLILGMGLPVTASYIVLGTLSAPALYQLISEQFLLQAVMEGAVPEAAKAIFLLIDPEKVTALGQGLSEVEARQLVAAIPIDFKSTLLEQTLSPEVLTMALLSAHMIIFWLSQDSNVTPPVCLTAFAAAAIAKTPPMRTGLTAWKVAKGLYIVPLLMAYTSLMSTDWRESAVILLFAIPGIYALAAAIEGWMESALRLPERLAALICGALLLWPHQQLWISSVALLAFLTLFIHNRSRISVP